MVPGLSPGLFKPSAVEGCGLQVNIVAQRLAGVGGTSVYGVAFEVVAKRNMLIV